MILVSIFSQQKSNIARNEVEEKVLLKTEVTQINWKETSQSIVKCADGSVFNADHVIVTASLGFLKHNHEKIFTPELPLEKQQVIADIPFGAVGKIFLEFDQKFWADDWVGFSLLWSDEDLKKIEGTENDW